MSSKNVQVILANRPTGWVQESDFKIIESDIPKPGPGQVLVKNLYLSLDPYMRGRMNAGPSYAANVAIGQVMVGGTAGESRRVEQSELQTGRLGGWIFRMAAIRAFQRRRVAEGRRQSRPALGVPWRGRHAGPDRMVGTARYRRAQGGRDRGRVGGRRSGRQHRRANREAQGMPRGRNRGRRGKSATWWSRSSASMRASITKAATSPRIYARPRPRASTSISRMSAGWCWRPSRCNSIRSRASRFADSSRNTTSRVRMGSTTW